MRWLTLLKELVIYLGIPVLVFMAIHYNTKLGQQTVATQNIVKSQSKILEAIKQVTTDTNLTAQQQADTIICMLQVPINQRTTDTKKQCRSEAIAVRDSNIFQTPGNASKITQTPVASSSPKPTTATPSPQPDNSPSNLQQLKNTGNAILKLLNPFN